MTRDPWRMLVVALALVAAACSHSGPDGVTLTSDQQATVDQAIQALVNGGFSRDGATCYVDGLVQAYGVERITGISDAASVPDDMAATAAQLLADCNVFAGLGGTGTVTDYRELAQPRDQVTGPYTYGEDATLDALWDQCAAGSGDACDSLFIDSPVGSEYEAFGNTCGNRPELDYDCSSLTP